VEATKRSQKIRLAAAKTRKNSNSVFFAKVRKIMDYYSQKTVGYLNGYRSERGIFFDFILARILHPEPLRLWTNSCAAYPQLARDPL
jgi:hypothetical protein